MLRLARPPYRATPRDRQLCITVLHVKLNAGLHRVHRSPRRGPRLSKPSSLACSTANSGLKTGLRCSVAANMTCHTLIYDPLALYIDRLVYPTLSLDGLLTHLIVEGSENCCRQPLILRVESPDSCASRLYLHCWVHAYVFRIVICIRNTYYRGLRVIRPPPTAAKDLILYNVSKP